MARDFPGNAANYLAATDVASVDVTGDYLTILAWVRPDVVNTDQAVASKYDGPTQTEHQYILRLDTSGFVRGYIGDAAGDDFVVGVTALRAGIWQTIGMRKAGTGANALNVYLNGNLTGSATSNKSIQNTATDFRIGKTSNTGIQPWDGLIAHVAIWNVGLSDDEIRAFARGVSPLQIRRRNLRAYWPLDDYGASGQARDAIEAQTTLSMTGAVPLAPFPYILDNKFAIFVGGDTPPIPPPTYVDTAVVYLDISVLGGECFSTFTGTFLGEGEADLRWIESLILTRWTGEANLRWSPGEVQPEGIHC